MLYLACNVRFEDECQRSDLRTSSLARPLSCPEDLQNHHGKQYWYISAVLKSKLYLKARSSIRRARTLNSQAKGPLSPIAYHVSEASLVPHVGYDLVSEIAFFRSRDFTLTLIALNGWVVKGQASTDDHRVRGTTTFRMSRCIILF